MPRSVRAKAKDSSYRPTKMIEEIVVDGQLFAIIISATHDEPGIQFFTPHNLSLQLASMSYSKGKTIAAHSHMRVKREVFFSQEALFIRKGKVRVDFYSHQEEYKQSRILNTGDVILLITGGHGFEILEDSNIVEVKQGPYAGEGGTVRFTSKLPDGFKYG